MGRLIVLLGALVLIIILVFVGRLILDRRNVRRQDYRRMEKLAAQQTYTLRTIERHASEYQRLDAGHNPLATIVLDELDKLYTTLDPSYPDRRPLPEDR